MRKKIIYTAGLMTGLSRNEALDWRYKTKASLNESFEVYVPEFDGDSGVKTGNEIWIQDYFQLDNSDIILVNMDYPNDRPFVGTSMEIARAFYQRKPIVMYSSYDWAHLSKTFQYHCVKILESLPEAIDYIQSKFY